MSRRHPSRAVLALCLLAARWGAIAAEGDEDEGRRRIQRLLAFEQRQVTDHGTSDLTDLTRRAAVLGAREAENDRGRIRSLLGQAYPLYLAPAQPVWTSLGPTSRFFATQMPSDGAYDAGLVASIAAHPLDSKVLLVGTASGGVWRSTDTGATWAQTTSDSGVLQIGAVAFAPSDPSRAYAGTGCADGSTYLLGPAWTPGYSQHVSVGIGVLASTDGGVTWTPRTPSGEPPPHRVFWQILVDPQSPDILLTAGEGGLQRSTDGGVTFAKVLGGEGFPWTTSIARSAAAPNVLLASTWGPASASVPTPGSVYKSTDGGLTWAEKDSGLPAKENRSRLLVAASPSSASRFYALLADASDKTLAFAVSDDAGETWTLPTFDPEATPILGTQGNFAISMAVDPQSPDTVYAGGTDLWKTTDRGVTWTKISDWRGRSHHYVHADHHAMAFAADNALFVGHDGGVDVTSDGGTTFRFLGRGLATFLVSDMAEDPGNPERICFGAQDNGPNIRLQGTEYRQPTTGDGFGCAFHRTDPQLVLFAVQKQSMWLSKDGGQTTRSSIQGLSDARGSQSSFATVLLSHPTEASTVFTFSRDKVWVTRDFAESWSKVSEHMPSLGAIADMTMKVDEPSKMYLVDGKRQVVASSDGGVSWTKLGDVPGTYLASIRVGSDGRIWVASRDPRRSQDRLWVSSDGASWTTVSRTGEPNGLPDLPLNSLAVEPSNPNVVFAGSFIGLYRSGDGGQTWARHGVGLPNAPVRVIRIVGDKVRVGTFGRGIWETLTAPGAADRRPSTTSVAPAASFTYEPSSPRPGRTLLFTDTSTGSPTSHSWSFGDGTTSTEEWPFHVFTQPGSYTVTLTVRNDSGQSSATQTLTVAYPDTGTGEALTYLVPVVLTSAGAGGTSFSTELTLANRSGRTLNLTFRTKGTFEATSTFSLPAGQLVASDVFEFLRAQTGMAVPSGNVVTSLLVEVRNADNLGQFGAQVRVTTPPNAEQQAQGISGRFGLSFPAVPLKTGASREAVVYGLQQTSSAGQPGTRSNLACVHAGTGSLGSLRLEVTYTDGATGRVHAQKDVLDLTAFQFSQLGQPLLSRGITNGYASVKRVAGNDQFVCYGVLNDNINGDGSYVPMVVADSPAPASEAVIPVIVGTDRFRSELTLANRTRSTVGGYFELVPSGSAEHEFGEFDLEPGRQYVFSDIVTELRNAGFNAPNGTVASLLIEFEEVPPEEGPQEEPTLITTDLVYAGVRTYASRAGGLFGLAYSYGPIGAAADTEAYVYGLQQSGVQGQQAGTRSNLAVVHALGGDLDPLTFEVTYYGPDGAVLGTETCDPSPCRLLPGQWRQFNSPLARFGVPHGYARIRRLSGSDQFIAYGVLNDQLNDDGSFAPMSVP